VNIGAVQHTNPFPKQSSTGTRYAVTLGAMRKSKKTKAQAVSFAQIRKLKAQDRQRDWDRLARGEVTPEQLQAENAWVRNTRECRILNSAQAA